MSDRSDVGINWNNWISLDSPWVKAWTYLRLSIWLEHLACNLGILSNIIYCKPFEVSLFNRRGSLYLHQGSTILADRRPSIWLCLGIRNSWWVQMQRNCSNTTTNYNNNSRDHQLWRFTYAWVSFQKFLEKNELWTSYGREIYMKFKIWKTVKDCHGVVGSVRRHKPIALSFAPRISQGKLAKSR